jgi:hypothetical protein
MEFSTFLLLTFHMYTMILKLLFFAKPLFTSKEDKSLTQPFIVMENDRKQTKIN